MFMQVLSLAILDATLLHLLNSLFAPDEWLHARAQVCSVLIEQRHLTLRSPSPSSSLFTLTVIPGVLGLDRAEAAQGEPTPCKQLRPR